MSAHRTKRPFAGAASDPAQRQITSFFNSTGSSATTFDTSSSYGSRIPQQPPSTPSLPASVQTNLLAVGMRVRKSVPEGYKTSSPHSAFSLWDESDCTAMTPSSASEGRSRANAFSAPRELLPFCGIHKVGGLGTQLENDISLSSLSSAAVSPTLADTTMLYQPSVINIDDDDDMPGLTSSQESMASTDSALSINTTTTTAAATQTRKRSFADEEEEEEAPETPDRLNIWRNAQYDGEISPCSLAPVGWGNGRVMAVPRKGRLRNRAGAPDPALALALAPAPREMVTTTTTTMLGIDGAAGLKGRLGQENVMIVTEDFDEADFLDRNPSWEVEMSDI